MPHKAAMIVKSKMGTQGVTSGEATLVDDGLFEKRTTGMRARDHVRGHVATSTENDSV